MKKKQTTQIAAIILVLGILYTGYQIYQFRSEEYPILESERQRLESSSKGKQSELRKLQKFAQNIENVKKELKELSIQLESALEYMPRTFNLAKLLRKLTELSQNSGVELQTFRPRKGEDKPPGTFYATTNLDLDIEGSFTQTLVFLDQVSRMKRILNIESLRMKVEAGSPNRGGQMTAKTLLALKTYRFNE